MTLKVYVGFDPRQPVAFTVALYSLMSHASKPISVTPLDLSTLPIKRRGLTEFTYSRFLVPWLCDYQGRALFVDSDVMFRTDVHQIPQTDDAIQVVKSAKIYEWPSVMLFNCEKCKVLTPEFIENEKALMACGWAETVGELPPEWNHLVGYYPPNPDAKLVHFTQGIPCFDETYNDEHGEEWRKVRDYALSTVSWTEMMGSSVHVQSVQQRRS